MTTLFHAIWHALQPYIGELLVTLVIALAAKLHLDWSKHKAKIQSIIDAVISEIADIDESNKNSKKIGEGILDGVEKKAVIVNQIAARFDDPHQPWWSSGKKKAVLKAFGSIPALVEKAFTVWSSARSIKAAFK
jgi:hypothetical protein